MNATDTAASLPSSYGTALGGICNRTLARSRSTQSGSLGMVWVKALGYRFLKKWMDCDLSEERNGVPSGLANARGIVENCLISTPFYFWFWQDAYLVSSNFKRCILLIHHCCLFCRALFFSIAWLEDINFLPGHWLSFDTILLICVLLCIALHVFFISFNTIDLINVLPSSQFKREAT